MAAKYSHRVNEKGSCSHVYNRGVGKKIIFNDKQDYEIFLGFLKDYLTAPQDSESIKKTFTVNGRVFRGIPRQPKNYFNKIELIAYSLMPNHFHLLLYQTVKGSIQNFVKSLSIRYSIYFNKKYQNTGTLFEGPYKSVQIEDKSRLLHLTRFLHHGNIYSSSSEYLGTRVTPWIKPQIVLSFINNGTTNYKDFIEKNELGQKDKELLEGITLESEAEHFGTNDTVRNEEIHLDTDSKSQLNVPGFLAITTIVFLLLVGLGVRNIMATTNEGFKPIPTPVVLSEKSEVDVIQPIPTPVVLSEKAETDEIQPTPTPEVVSEKSEVDVIQPKTMLTIKINDGSVSVNIRQKPTTNSEKIGEAKEGDTFEFIFVNSSWYEVKLADGSTGFISARYIEVVEETNN